MWNHSWTILESNLGWDHLCERQGPARTQRLSSSSSLQSSSKSFVPLEDLSLLAAEKSFKDKKKTSFEDKRKTVWVVWDFNTCPLTKDYNLSILRENINQSLRHIDLVLEVEAEMFAAGNTYLLGGEDHVAKLQEFFKIVKCDERIFVCNILLF